jgi:Leucine-rich repeat (LRR) protein
MMKQFLIFLSVFICLSIHAIGQNITADLFQQPANTGSNMTVAINASSLDQYEGGQIGAFYDINGDGTLQCVGLEQITTGFFGLALWGDDSFTTESDGLSTGDIPQFAILFDGNVIPFNESPEFTGFQINGIFFVTNTDLPSQILYPIEDPNFLSYLQENYPQTIVNDSLDINATIGIETLILINDLNLTSIDGIQYFDDLTYLDCSNNQLTSLPELPNGLTDLNCSSNQLTSLPELPNGLTDLNCSINQLTSLPELPNGLAGINCYFNQLTSLPELPESLLSLLISNNELTSLPELPESLLSLSISNNELTSLPELPNGLITLDFDDNQIECITNYLDDFIELSLYNLCFEYLGCSDPNACNYDSNVTNDDGSCNFAENYFDCNGNCINDDNEDGICDELEISEFCEQYQWLIPFQGNTGSNMTLLLQESFVTSLNIQTNNAYIVATTETGLVVGSSYLNNSQTSLAVWGDDAFTPEILDGATDGQLINLHLIDSNLLYDINTSFNYVTNNLDVITNEVSPILTCTAENLGCTDESACNYNAEAIIEDGSCSYSETYFDCNGNCINNSDADDICDELEIPGCTNPNASNYNNIATDDDGTCIILGCTDQEACNYDAEANTDDESCFYAETYLDCNGNCINDSDADDICDELEVPGCTNPNASNYNSNATDDDGTCMILGCTDQEACNWDAEANTDDESCFYAETYYNCDGSCINDFDLDGECDEIDYDDDIGINEVECESAQLIKMIDVLGREYKEHKKGMLLFYIYQNGKVEKRVIH